MKYLRLKTLNPYFNLAVEEAMFNNYEEDVFILWQNEPTVVIGVNQNAYAEVDLNCIDTNNIHLARRITGGGAVYHDLGNVNYSFIKCSPNIKGIDFVEYTEPIINALKTLHVNAALSGRNDLLVSGRKISGNAQHTKGNKVLHHGTLLFNSDFDILSKVLLPDNDKLSSKAVKSVRSRVANIKEFLDFDLKTQDFIDIIESYIVNEFSCEKIECPKWDEISKIEERNSSKEWIFPNRSFVSDYEIVNKKRFACGSVEARLKMSDSIIRDIKIFGDFFGIKPISELENLINGSSLNNVSVVFNNININEYINNMTTEDFLNLIST